MFKVETEPQYQSSADRHYRRMTGPQTADRKLGCNQYKGLCRKRFAAGIWGHKWLCCKLLCSTGHHALQGSPASINEGSRHVSFISVLQMGRIQSDLSGTPSGLHGGSAA